MYRLASASLLVLLSWPASSRAQWSVREIALPKPSTVSELGFGLAMTSDADTVIVTYDGGFATYDITRDAARLRTSTPCTGGASSCLSFGWAAALDDDRLAVSGPERDGLFFYTRNAGGGWDLVRRDGPPSGFGYFGYSVALAGPHLLVATPYYNSSRGYASTYLWSPGSSPRLATTSRTEPSPDLYGFRVDTDGELAVVACIGPSCGAASGRIYVYVVDASGSLTALTSLSPPTAGMLGQCGHGLDLAADALVIGCRYDSSEATYAGSVFVYPRTGRGAATVFGSPTRIAPPTGSTRFGESVVASHGMVFVTDPQSLVTEPWRTRFFGYEGSTLRWGGYSGSDASVGDGRVLHGAIEGVTGRVLLVGAPGQFGALRAGAAWLYHVGLDDAERCTVAADCLSGSCNAGVCGPAPTGARCDWTVSCVGRCLAGTCAPPPPLMSVREIPLTVPPDTHHFGQAAALDRERVIVSSNFLLSSYEPTASGATMRASRACDGLTEGDCAGFGRALALFGDRLAVGIQNANGYRGELARYTLEGFALLPATPLRTPASRTDGAELGAAIALGGEWLAASAPFAASNTGEVTTYRWSPGGALSGPTATSEPSSHLYGYLGLAIDGDFLVVGCTGERCGGATGQVFTYQIGSSGALTRIATLRPPATASRVGASSAASCGASVALSEDHLFVSCPLDGRDRLDGGAVFAYPRSGTTVTDAPVRIAPRDGRQGRFGESVHESHGLVFVTDLEGGRTGAGVRGRVWAFDAEGDPLLSGYEGSLRRAAPDEHRMVLATARDTVGHALVVGAFRASADQGEATLYHVGYRDGVACTRASDCLSGGCVGEVCGPAPRGAACDWTVTCATGLACEAHVCMGPELDAGMATDASAGLTDAWALDDGGADSDASLAIADAGTGDGDGAPSSTDSGTTGADAGTRPRIPFSCTCRAGSRDDSAGWLGALLLVLVVGRRARLARTRPPRERSRSGGVEGSWSPDDTVPSRSRSAR